jgi:NAD-dependent dihydropyrimidine dehydrogenase PreA subunit
MGCNATLRAVIQSLRRAHPCRWGAPTIDRVDTDIFVRTYFVHCMQCTYCHDSCCQYGVDVDASNVARLDAHADALSAYAQVPREGWFTDEWTVDGEFPSGSHTRTRVKDGACVFRSRAGRGCLIHSYALDRGIDYHELKPMVSVLFPVTFDGGLLHPSNEIQDRSLQCIDDGPSLYKGVRGEIGWYFGEDLLSELDELEARELAGRAASK